MAWTRLAVLLLQCLPLATETILLSGRPDAHSSERVGTSNLQKLQRLHNRAGDNVNDDISAEDFDTIRRSHAEERMKAFLAKRPLDKPHQEDPSLFKWGVVIGFMVVSMGASGVVATEWFISMIIGREVASIIRKKTPGSIGVKANFGKVKVNLFKGRIHIMNMRLHNPKTKPRYTTDYLFFCEEIAIEIKTGKLLKSRLKEVEIEELKFHNLKVAYERPSVFAGKSNVKDIQDFVAEKKRKKGKDKKSWLGTFRKEKNEEKPKDDKKDDKEEQPEEKPKDDKEYIVHKVDMEGLKVEAKIKGADVVIPLPEIKADDLSQSCTGTTGDDVVHALVLAMAKGLIVH